MEDTGGGKEGCKPPPIIFTEALVLKSGSTRKFSKFSRSGTITYYLVNN